MHRKRTFFTLVTILAILLAIFLNLPRFNPSSLATPATPQAAAAYVAELAARGETANKRIGVYTDFAFIACYTTLLIAACNWAGRIFEQQGLLPAARAAQFMIGMVLATVVVDVAEDIALLQLLAGTTDDVWLRIAKVTARLKFTIPAAPVGYVAYAFIRSRRTTTAATPLHDQAQ
jgi:hypothetical protein